MSWEKWQQAGLEEMNQKKQAAQQQRAVVRILLSKPFKQWHGIAKEGRVQMLMSSLERCVRRGNAHFTLTSRSLHAHRAPPWDAEKIPEFVGRGRVADHHCGRGSCSGEAAL